MQVLLGFLQIITGLPYAKVLSGKKSQKNKKSKKKAPKKMGVLNLITNDSLEFLDVVNYKFSGAGAYLAMKRQKKGVHTLIVKNLKQELKQHLEISKNMFGKIKEPY